MSRDRKRPRLFRGVPIRRSPDTGPVAGPARSSDTNEAHPPSDQAVPSGPRQAAQVLDAFEERPTIRIDIPSTRAVDDGVVAAASPADAPVLDQIVPDAASDPSDTAAAKTAGAPPLRIFVGLPDPGGVTERDDWAPESATEEVLIDPRVGRVQMQPPSADPQVPVIDPQAAPDPPAWDDASPGPTSVLQDDLQPVREEGTRPTGPPMAAREMPGHAQTEETRDAGGQQPLLGWDDAEPVSIAARERSVARSREGEDAWRGTQQERPWGAAQAWVQPAPAAPRVGDGPASSSWTQAGIALMTVVAVAAAALQLSAGPAAGTDPLALLQWALASPAAATTAAVADSSGPRSTSTDVAGREGAITDRRGRAPAGAPASPGRSVAQSGREADVRAETGALVVLQGQQDDPDDGQGSTIAARTASDESGLLRVKMDFDAAVYVDGRWVGEDLIDALELPVGVHEVSVVPTGGGRVRQVRVGVTARRPAEVRFGR